MNYIQNPILPGFHPDPSIIRVGDDYYIATSTFEWFPGVQIFHSKDLIHWRLIARPLNRLSQLDMRGTMNNYGVWAPCLSYDNGTFYLVYSNVRYLMDEYRDCHNYLTTTKDITGDWSEPIPLKSNYADYSLFHDGDKKWLVSPSAYSDEGLDGRVIAIQEYSETEKKLIGPIRGIFVGTDLGTAEGPHLYHINGYYYLITAEGGTGFGHAVTVARSKNLFGPYEVDPNNPILTARGNPELTLQKAGHADIVETQNGEWYMVHLCGRPISEKKCCILGRETAIQKVEWTEDGWLRLSSGKNTPEEIVPAPLLPEAKWPALPVRDDFDSEQLNIHFQTPRIPLGEDTLSLTERPGFLRLKGKESLSSIYHQALVARRQEAFCYTASTCVEYSPVNPLQAAGLVCYYNTYAYHYLQICYQKGLGRCLDVVTCEGEHLTHPFQPVKIGQAERCFLRADMAYDKLIFSYSFDGENWENIGGPLDSTILSDEFYYAGMSNFTGAFVGLCCQDLSGGNLHADFDFFEYIEK